MAENQKGPDEQNTPPGNQEKKSNIKPAKVFEHGTVAYLTKTHENGDLTKNYMWVEGTGNSKYFPKGEKAMVHVLSGEKLISKKAAIKTTPPPPEKEIKAKKSEEEDD